MSRTATERTLTTRPRLSQPGRHRRMRLVAAGAALALALVGCSGDGGGGSDTAPDGWVEPDYAGAPSDLTGDQVCDLLDDADFATHLGVEVTSATPGGSNADCNWTYQIPDGPSTNSHVQIMTMSQTSNRFGTEALEWALDRAPNDVEIAPMAGLDVPNGAYEFSGGMFMITLDQSGRVVTVSGSAETPESAHVALLKALLDALAAKHS